jgi:integrase
MKGGSVGFRLSPDTGAETWHARVYHDGKYDKTNLGTVRPEFEHKEAYKAALDWVQSVKDAGPAVAKAYTLVEVVDEYLRKLQGNSSPRNMDRRRQAAKRLDALIPPALYRRKVNDLVKKDITQLQRDYSQRKNKQNELISSDSVNRVMTHLVAALRYGYREDMVESDKAWKHYTRLKKAIEKRREKEYLSAQEREAFLNACPAELKAFCSAMNCMAARPSELRRLRVSDVDLKDSKVRLLTYKGSSGGSIRYFPLPANTAIRAIIEKQVRDKQPDDFVFTTERGIQWTQANLAKHHNKVRDDGKFAPAFESYIWRHCRVTDWAGKFPAPEVASLAGTSLKYVQENYYKSNADLRCAMAGM